MKDIVVVTASRYQEQAFWKSTLLGQSLKRIGLSGSLRIIPFFENSLGLPVVYNRTLVNENRDVILLFVHDDVYIDDYWLVERLNEASEKFDIIGIAGSSRIVAGQLAWPVLGLDTDGKPVWDDAAYLSGRVAHPEKTGAVVSVYGESPKECKQLDGLFIAVDCAKLLDKGIRFDERFDFHCYDLDFSRTCADAGLKVGTWPIAVTHASGGNFGSPEWRNMLQLYRQKWA